MSLNVRSLMHYASWARPDIDASLLQQLVVEADATACCSLCSHPLFRLEPNIQEAHRKRGKAKHRAAYLCTPAKSITEQLAMLLSQPGVEQALKLWCHRSQVSGWLTDFFDGAISKTLLGPDGLPFFQCDIPVDNEGELRIGLALGIDWFVPPQRAAANVGLRLRLWAGSCIFAVLLPHRTPPARCLLI